MSTTIVLDCDPGIDDALAIAFAHGHPAIELAGITTVAGNVGLARTTRNALAVADFVGATTVPVAAGCATPLLRPALDAADVHGETGLGGAVLPEPARGPEGEHAVDFLIRTLGASPGEITLVATGPLTNIAMAVRKEPRIIERVAEVVLMGGAVAGGNRTAAAESNIVTDPEAAHIVFGERWPVTMVGLELTVQAVATPDVVDRIAGLGTTPARYAARLPHPCRRGPGPRPVLGPRARRIGADRQAVSAGYRRKTSRGTFRKR